MTSDSSPWRSLFEHWPASLPKHGTLVTSFGESIAFTGFLLSGGVMIVERERPDTAGARKVIVAYSAILAVKLSDPGELTRYQVLGFQPPM